MQTQLEYLGFTTKEITREYRLRVRQPAGEFQEVTLVIPNEAFLAHRVRYQDAPDLCFHKLQREMALADGALPAARLNVSETDFEEYKKAHTPAPPQRRKAAPVMPSPHALPDPLTR